MDDNLKGGLSAYLKYQKLNRKTIDELFNDITQTITWNEQYKIAIYMLSKHINLIIPDETEETSKLLEKWYLLTMLLKINISIKGINESILKIDRLHDLYKNKSAKLEDLFSKKSNNVYMLKDIINDDELDKIFLLTNDKNDRTRLRYHANKYLKKNDLYYMERTQLEEVCKDKMDMNKMSELFDEIPMVHKVNGNKKEAYLYEEYCRHETNIKSYIESLLIYNNTSDEDNYNATLKKNQMVAYNNAINNKLSMILGLPGTGKSTTTAAISKYLMDNGYNMYIMAPTGLATSKLENGIKQIANTKKYQKMMTVGTIDYFNIYLRKKNEEDDNIVVIIDEFSMVSIKLFSDLINNLRILDVKKIILIGDTNQLPSIRKGSLLYELVNYGNTKHTQIEGNGIFCINNNTTKRIIPHVELREIMRTGDDKELAEIFQKMASKSITPEQKINMLKNNKSVNYVDYVHGIEQVIVNKKILFSYDKNNDDDNGKKIVDIKNKIKNLVFLTSTRKGADEINKMVRQKLYGRHANEEYQIKDRIMCTKNGKYGNKIRINNGEIYYILNKRLINGKHEYEIIFDGNLNKRNPVIIKINNVEMNKFKYAYCLTIHKSQSCEWDDVVVLLQKNNMLNLNLLYTGITRSKINCTLVSSYDTLNECLSKEAPILNTYIPHRELNHKKGIC